MNIFGWLLFAGLIIFLVYQGIGLVKDVIKSIKRRKANEHKKSIVEEETDVVGVYGERTNDNRDLEE